MTRDLSRSELSSASRALMYINESQQRVLRVLLALSGQELSGLAPGELAKGLGISPSHVTRDLANLHAAGLAEEIVGLGRWRLTPKLIQIGVAMQLAVEEAERKLEETRLRYTRAPR
jgi:DNA-binding IclR family transcriptional regulator